MSGCDKALSAHFKSAASLTYHTSDITPSNIMLTPDRPVPFSQCWAQTKEQLIPFLKSLVWHGRESNLQPPGKDQINMGIRSVVAKELRFLRIDSENWSDWADTTLIWVRWVHMSFCWLFFMRKGMTLSFNPSDRFHPVKRKFYFLFYSDLMSLSTIFQLYHDGVWMWQGVQC